MTIYVSEAEMIERFTEGLTTAADRAKQFITALEPAKPQLFVEFLHGIKVAAGSAHQLALSQENTNFLKIRDHLEGVIAVSQDLPTFTGAQGPLWTSIKESLERLSERGKSMATSKGMKRSDVLVELAIREQNARMNLDS